MNETEVILELIKVMKELKEVNKHIITNLEGIKSDVAHIKGRVC